MSPEPAHGFTAAVRPPRRIGALVALVLALIGTALAILLVREHLAVAEGGLVKGFLCSGAGRFDCNAVAAHPTSWLLGQPVALWGLVFYITMVALALHVLLLPAALAAAATSIGLFLSILAVLIDGWLAYQMITQIGAVCLQCVATYAVNLALVVCYWMLDTRADAKPDFRGFFLPGPPWIRRLATTALMLAGLGVAVFITQRELGYLRQFAREETEEFLAKTRHQPEIDMRRFAGLPTRGPAGAPLSIVVVGDFECQFCRALAAHVDRLRAEHPDEIREVFLNAPVSSDCNPGVKENVHEHACALAEMGACAARQGKFWEFHDAMFHELPQPQVTAANARRLLPALGIDPAEVERCLADSAARAEVARDVELCRDLKITNVPTVVINGHVRRGGVYPAMLRTVVEVMLASR